VITPVGGTWLLWSSANGMRIYNGSTGGGGAVPQLNKWTHYAVTFDRVAQRYSCYVNGVKTVNSIATGNKTAPTAATLWKVGHNEGASDGDYFRGQLDDFRVYNRLLTDSQIAALYAAAPPFFQLVAQPQSVSVMERNPASFTVGADGSVPISVQWQRNGVDIPGATNTTLTFSYATMADNGARYRAVIHSSLGDATSSEATLTVTALPAPDITSSLVLHYTFDETNGDTAYDSSGNVPANDATLYNWAAGAPKWEPGVLGNALHFNAVGTANYVMTMGAPNLANSTDFTFTFWAKCDPTNSPGTGNPRFFATANSKSWAMWERSSSPYGVGFWHGPGGTPSLETNAWHHYIVTYSRIANNYDVYVDGVRTVKAGIPTNPSPEPDPSGYAWVIGHHETLAPTPNDAESFRGWLDDMRMYNRIFNLNDAEYLYQAANQPPTLSMQVSGGTLTFSWPSWAGWAYTLKSATSLAPGATWTTVSGSPILTNATMIQTDAVGAGTRFYRLVK
jgi:hypothetical protein